jgi:hypothetical protein
MLTFFAENPIAAVIVACEIGLWVLLGLGMVLRYVVRLRRTSTAPCGYSAVGRRVGHRDGDRPAPRRRRRPCACAGGVLPGLEPGLRARDRPLGRRSVRPPVRRRACAAPHTEAWPRTRRTPDAGVVPGRRHGRDRVRRARRAHLVLRGTGGSAGLVVVDRSRLGGRRPVVRVRPALGEREKVSAAAEAAADRRCHARHRAAWRPESGPYRPWRRGS